MNSTSIDLAIRIKNGYMGKKGVIEGLYSKMNESIIQILKREKYIKDYSIEEKKGIKSLNIELLYINGESVMQGVRLYSKQGRRVYGKLRELKPVLGGFGIALITTPFGVLTDKEAREKKTGGEILFEIW